MMPKQSDMGEILSEMASGACCSPSAHVVHRRRMEIVMRHLASKKVPLTLCASPQYLDRCIDTLKRYAREFALSFPDYTPLALREKPAKAQK